ncbi:hypothetical protein JCM8547_000922 [Rhodosporidiobolus lusitaniae]
MEESGFRLLKRQAGAVGRESASQLGGASAAPLPAVDASSLAVPVVQPSTASDAPPISTSVASSAPAPTAAEAAPSSILPSPADPLTSTSAPDHFFQSPVPAPSTAVPLQPSNTPPGVTVTETVSPSSDSLASTSIADATDEHTSPTALLASSSSVSPSRRSSTTRRLGRSSATEDDDLPSSSFFPSSSSSPSRPSSSSSTSPSPIAREASTSSKTRMASVAAVVSVVVILILAGLAGTLGKKIWTSRRARERAKKDEEEIKRVKDELDELGARSFEKLLEDEAGSTFAIAPDYSTDLPFPPTIHPAPSSSPLSRESSTRTAATTGSAYERTLSGEYQQSQPFPPHPFQHDFVAVEVLEDDGRVRTVEGGRVDPFADPRV